nr:helix-turn-helix domain-containing protein [Escherichia coli]
MGKRRDAREQIEAKIVELGRRQLLDHGAAGLSLRAIARNLGMVSSAVYRYVSSRDELLTLLLVDAYSDLADTVDRAHETLMNLVCRLLLEKKKSSTSIRSYRRTFSLTPSK